MKKLKLFVTAMLAMFVATVGVHALELKVPEDVSAADSYTSDSSTIDIDAEDKSDVTITYDGGNFKMVDKDADEEHRGMDAAWVGVKVFAPASEEIIDLKKAKYYLDDTTEGSFWENQDTPELNKDTQGAEHFIYIYAPITQDLLTAAVENHTPITYTWRFDWDGDKEIDQTITVLIKTEKIELKDLEENVVWNEEKYEEVAEAVAKAEEEASAHKVIVTESKNGKVTVDKTSAKKGEKVTLTITPEKDYELDKLVVKDANGKELTVTKGVFEMPATDVTISATFKKVAVQETTTEKTEEENPKTGDNILMYLSLGLASVAVSAVSVKKFRKSN